MTFLSDLCVEDTRIIIDSLNDSKKFLEETENFTNSNSTEITIIENQIKLLNEEKKALDGPVRSLGVVKVKIAGLNFVAKRFQSSIKKKPYSKNKQARFRKA